MRPSRSSDPVGLIQMRIALWRIDRAELSATDPEATLADYLVHLARPQRPGDASQRLPTPAVMPCVAMESSAAAILVVVRPGASRPGPIDRRADRVCAATRRRLAAR